MGTAGGMTGGHTAGPFSSNPWASGGGGAYAGSGGYGTRVSSGGAFDRAAADAYKIIRDTKGNVPDHKGSTAVSDENLEWFRRVRNHLKGAHKDVQPIL